LEFLYPKKTFGLFFFSQTCNHLTPNSSHIYFSDKSRYSSFSFIQTTPHPALTFSLIFLSASNTHQKYR
jgi:hypothetical protein